MYLPDFEFKDRYIEIKSNYTFDICIGKRFLGESDKKRHFQMKKINFVREYIKPVQVIVLNKKSRIKFFKLGMGQFGYLVCFRFFFGFVG